MASRVTAFEIKDFDIDETRVWDVLSSLEESETFSAMQSLCTTPGAFSNCTELSIWLCMADEPFGVVNTTLLQNLYKGFPKLTSVSLKWDDEWGDDGLTPKQFGTMAQSLQMPLEHLHLFGFTWLEDDHVVEFVCRQGEALEILRIDMCEGYEEEGQITDKTLFAIAWNCPAMSYLSLAHTSITAAGVRNYIRSNGYALSTLGIDHCPNVGPELVDYFVELGPILKSLSLEGYMWLTDELLDRLVQGQVDCWAGVVTSDGRRLDEEIPCEQIYVGDTSVTEAGARRVVAKPKIGQLTINGDGWTVSNRTERDEED
jgi:hypothetical protein